MLSVVDAVTYIYPKRFALDETTGNIYVMGAYSRFGIITPHRTYLELDVETIRSYARADAIALHPAKG